MLGDLNNGMANSGYIIKSDPVEDMLEKVKIAFMSETSASPEALAFGASLIIPLQADYIFLTPLARQDNLFTRVSNLVELKEAVLK